MLSNTAVPIYYGKFRDDVLAGKIPVNKEISLEMNRIDYLIESPYFYYDDEAINGYIEFCENELTLTDGSDLVLLDSFKLWAEELLSWFYFVEKSEFVPGENGKGRYIKRQVKQRLTHKQYLILGRGGAKSLYDSTIHAYFLNVDTSSTHQVAIAPTMKQAEEVLQPIRVAITRSRGPFFKFLTEGSLQNTTGPKSNRVKLASTKKGIENFVTGSLLEIRPMSIDKTQGLRTKVATVDEWLSGDTKEDVIGSLEQSGSKMPDYMIVASSSEGTVRNGCGDTTKMELLKILNGEYYNPHVSIFYYRLDDIKEVGDPDMWIKANPNIGKTVSYEAYQLDVERAEHAPGARNDILAKRFGIPVEGFTYFFTYDETLPHTKKSFFGMPCSLGIDMSLGDDFFAFTFLFPLQNGCFGVKARSYISSVTMQHMQGAMRVKYEEFIAEGTLIVMEGTILEPADIYDDINAYIDSVGYDVRCVGYDPYNAAWFMQKWALENGEFGIEKVIQGARTESVPLGELKKLSEERMLLFDEAIMQYTMGNSIVIEDTNGNRKLQKERRDKKIDNVSAMMDAYVSYKLNKEAFE